MNPATTPLLSVVIPTRNAFEQTARTVRALLRQRLPQEAAIEIIVVDDASTDGAADQLDMVFGSNIVLLRQQQNAGRSATRNHGAHATQGRWLVMLDCDCVPAATDYLMQFLEQLRDDRVCIGAVDYQGEGFWPRYQRLGAVRRLNSHQGGETGALSTANMALSRQRFLDVGGYDEGYRHYGFEDRDLLLRLHAANITAHYVEAARTLHADFVDLRTLMAKNTEAARFTAPRFRTDHPQAFARLDYARIDAAFHPLCARMGAWLSLVFFPLAPLGERWLQCGMVPWRLRLAMTRSFLAAAYCCGSIKSLH